MDSMSVLFFSSWYPEANNKSLGIFIQRHAEALTQVGVKVVVVAFETYQGDEIRFSLEPPRIKDLTEYKVLMPFKQKSTIQKVKSIFFGRKLFSDFFLSLKNEFNPAILQVNVAFPAGLIWWFFRDNLPRKIVLAEHWSGYLAEDGRYKGVIIELITQSLVRRSSAILVVSETLQSAMLQHGLKGNYFPLPNVVDSGVFSIGLDKSAEPFRFIHVSSLDKREKNPELMLRSFVKVLNHFPSSILTIVGGFEERILELKDYSTKIGINAQVVFKGAMRAEHLAQELKGSHAFVLSSNFEGQPVVILEALCVGLPVVAPAIGGIPEIVSESDGILFPCGDEIALSNAMVEIIKEYKRFNSKAISNRTSEKHAYKKVGNYLKEIYSKVLDGKA